MKSDTMIIVNRELLEVDGPDMEDSSELFPCPTIHESSQLFQGLDSSHWITFRELSEEGIHFTVIDLECLSLREGGS